jgi:hypothetical protein
VTALKSSGPRRSRSIQTGLGAILAVASVLVIIYCFLAGLNGDTTAAVIGLAAMVPFVVGTWLATTAA